MLVSRSTYRSIRSIGIWYPLEACISIPLTKECGASQESATHLGMHDKVMNIPFLRLRRGTVLYPDEDYCTSNDW